MASNRPITIQQSLADMANWPREWKIAADDVRVGKRIVSGWCPALQQSSVLRPGVMAFPVFTASAFWYAVHPVYSSTWN
jgi:hypothetical protein